MNANDHPRGAFGRRGLDTHAVAGLAEPTTPARATGRFVYLFGLTVALLAVAGFTLWTLAGIAALNAETAATTQRVIAIVNQPVTHLPLTGPVDLFSPGWFHPGATEPDFNNVDIRTTQEFPYRGSTYVSSDVNPSEMFVGSELEFNSMTKYFYVDRTLPKKRLSESEMLEINALYRTIGQNQTASFRHWATTFALIVGGICLGLALLPLIRRNDELPVS